MLNDTTLVGTMVPKVIASGVPLPGMLAALLVRIPFAENPGRARRAGRLVGELGHAELVPRVVVPVNWAADRIGAGWKYFGPADGKALLRYWQKIRSDKGC